MCGREKYTTGITPPIIWLIPLAVMIGAEGQMLEQCVLYGRILLLALPFFMLQFEFESFFVAAEKPQLGLAVTIVCGLTNMVLDALFIVVFSWGLVGAAAATVISQIIGRIANKYSKKNHIHIHQHPVSSYTVFTCIFQ